MQSNQQKPSDSHGSSLISLIPKFFYKNNMIKKVWDIKEIKER